MRSFKAVEDVVNVSKVVNLLAEENERLKRENAKLRRLLGEGLVLIRRLERKLGITINER